ncbi:hypothetical protein KUCAC02_032702, partial [Chaenocephalus aceratus]
LRPKDSRRWPSALRLWVRSSSVDPVGELFYVVSRCCLHRGVQGSKFRVGHRVAPLCCRMSRSYEISRDPEGSGRQPAAVHAGLQRQQVDGRELLRLVPPGAAVSGPDAGRTPGAGAGRLWICSVHCRFFNVVSHCADDSSCRSSDHLTSV